MSTTLQKRVALVAVAAVTLLAGVAVPAQAVETGTISGHFNGNGAPLANVSVHAWPNGPGSNGYATTNSEGAYEITGLAPGQYRVTFRMGDGPLQFAPGKTSYSAANLYSVSANAVTTVDDQALPTATIEGTLVNRQGLGVDHAQVVFNPTDWTQGAYESTYTSMGRFSKKVFTGKYLVQFYVGSTATGFGRYFQVAYSSDGDVPGHIFDATAGSTVVVNDTLLPTGSMSGRFTDTAGNGIPGVSVILSRDNVQMPHARTDANGNWAFPHVREGGQWKVHFIHYDLNFRQWAFGKVTEADATRIAITEGQTMVVNDSRLPTSTVRIKAVDAVTGAAIERFNGNVGPYGGGETGNGELVLTDIPVGTHPFSVGAYGFEYLDNAGSINVVEGQVASVTVALRPVARIETKVVDAVTGEPVPGVCLVAAQPQRFWLPDGCAYESTASGTLLLEAGAGWHQVLAFPANAAGYGAQWVGANGGTGSQLGAQLIKVETGKAAKAPVIKLDRAGTITGRVTTSSGAKPELGFVSIGDWSEFAGGGLGVVGLDDEGRYSVDYLGPYQWPLRFMTSDEGAQWSGQTGNRHLAQTVQVTAAATATYDFAFKAPVKLKATITGVAGDCYVFAFNAITGGQVGLRWAENCTQQVVAPVVGPQIIKIRVDYFDGVEWRERWYGGSSLNTAKPVILPGSGSKSVVIAF